MLKEGMQTGDGVFGMEEFHMFEKEKPFKHSMLLLFVTKFINYYRYFDKIKSKVHADPL